MQQLQCCCIFVQLLDSVNSYIPLLILNNVGVKRKKPGGRVCLRSNGRVTYIQLYASLADCINCHHTKDVK